MKYLFTLICYICFNILAHAQEIDSLTAIIESEVNDQTRLVAYQELSERFFKRNQYEQALLYAQKALSLAASLNDQDRQHAIFTQIGSIFIRQERYLEALNIHQKGLTLAQKLKDQTKEATSLSMIGKVHNNQNRLTKALRYQKEALIIARKLNNNKVILDALNEMGIIHQKQGRYDDAISTYQESLTLAQKVNNQFVVVVTLINMGIIYNFQGDLAASKASYREAAKLADMFNLDKLLGIALYKIGFFHLVMGANDSAFHYFDRYFAINEKLGNRRNRRTALHQIGNFYSNEGDVKNALSFYDKAYKLAQQVHDTLGVSQIYFAIADLHQTQQAFPKALQYQQKALALAYLLRDTSSIAQAKHGIAELLIATNQFSEALTYSFEALSYVQQLQDTCNFGSCFVTIGSAYQNMQQPDSAVYYFNNTIKYSKRCKEGNTLAKAYIGLGQLYEQNEQKQQALQSYEKALQYAQISQNRVVMRDAAQYIYPLYEQKGQTQKALATFKIFHANNDSLFNEENTRNLVQKEMKYAYEQEQQTLALAQKEKDLIQQQTLAEQRWLTYGISGILLAVIAIATIIYRNNKQKQQANELLRTQKAEIEETKEELENQQTVIMEKNETLKQQKLELEELDQLKSRFFANISHELRTPLTLISSPIQRLLKQEQLSPTVVDSLKLMGRNTSQLKDFVNDILDLSKLEANAIDLHEESIQISPFIQRVFSNFDSLAQHLNIHYHITMSEELSATWVQVDSAKMEKIVNNLLSNALKHSASGDQVSLTIHKDNEELVLAVRDTGQGISKADLPHIFNRFFQSKQSNIPLQGGTGIGLALTKELVQLMHGKIEVKSKERKGSCFTVYLPYQEGEAPQAIVAETELTSESLLDMSHLSLTTLPIEEKKFRVLVVEDHPEMQQFVASLLTHQYHIELANNGREALNALAKTSQIDLIISDVMMPELDGYGLLKVLKASEAYQHIPVIMLTALSDEAHKLDALTIGVDDYLTKPFSPEELLARVHNLLLRYEVRQQFYQDQTQEETVLANEVFSIGKRDVQTVTARQTDIDWLKEVAEIMHKELENSQFHLTDLADQFHLSERQFLRKMKKLTGLTPKKYQQELALNHARQLLEQEAYQNISAVSFSIGIKNVTRFNQLYEARFGKKPSEYFS